MKFPWNLSSCLWPKMIFHCKVLHIPVARQNEINTESLLATLSHNNSQNINIPFPTTRRPCVRKLPEETIDVINEWFSTCGVKLGSQLIGEINQNLILRLLYTYRDLHADKLEDMPPTDLYVHKIKIKAGTKPWNKRKQKRWPADKKWWLHKIVAEGVACKMYESTIAANGQFSEWNAQAVLVDKTSDPEWGAEPRITFNYRNVKEDLPGARMPLMSTIHEFLDDPKWKFFCQFDFKHSYWSISLDQKSRHYLAFTLDDLQQMQPTRLPQGSASATFGLCEALRIVFGDIPPLPDGQKLPDGSDGSFHSLLRSDSPNERAHMSFYMDNIFAAFSDFDEAFVWLRGSFFPRVAWGRFKLSFKKVFLFMESIVALGVQHFAGGALKAKPARAEKIRSWPVPTNVEKVRAFLASIQITKPWIKSFSEISRPLTRLLCSSSTERYGYDPEKTASMYTDASKYGTGCVIIQYHDVKGVLTERPTLYDSTLLNKTQRNYGTYKRELLAIVTYAKKYSYMFAGKQGKVMTDHKPLTRFLESPYLEGIYARWNADLSVLNLDIEYISGTRNVIADALSRTIFPDPDSEPDDILLDHGSMEQSIGGVTDWVWKDCVGGYAEF
ncbi:hypothetical protein EPUL_005966, partial [Erysiphe pulchra]